MTFTVSAPADAEPASGSSFTITEADEPPDARRGELEHTAFVAPGLGITWDPFAPLRWSSIVVAPSEGQEAGDVEMLPVLKGLVGDRSAADLHDAVRDLARSDRDTTEVPEHEVTGGDRSPWLRLAALETLDRWLYLPLNPALVEAERAATQVDAAGALSAESRSEIIAEALYRARRASAGLTRYLERLVLAGHRPPPPLENALRPLVGAYSLLTKELKPQESDDELVAVPEAWHRLSVLDAFAAAPPPRVPDEEEAGTGNGDLLDPRQFHARILRLAADPARPDIERSPIETEAGPAIRLRVKAFEPQADGADRLLVRLVDRRTGTAVGHALLTSYEAVIPLAGHRAEDVRCDVYDAIENRSPSADLVQVRRAVAVLGAGRRYAAERLFGPAGVPAILRDLGEQVSTGGPGALMAAELAAAYEPRLTRR